MWLCTPTIPGMTVCPARSITRAPSGARTDADGPTAAIRPSRMTIVWLRLGADPVPSITVTLVNATTGSATDTNCRTPVES